MMIDGKTFQGQCACGADHQMTTELCIIEPG
jgi:hypothetical protein